MTPTFNLLDEPWIRVSRLDGSSDEVSLLALFRQAQDIGGIHGEIASQDVAILRLLLAICHRTMGGPPDLATWRRYWDDPDLLAEHATVYLERYRDRFDLRDPQRPFFQVAGLHSASRKADIYDIGEIIADLPKPGRRLFTQRTSSESTTLPWPETARWLIHLHAYDGPGTHSLADGDTNPNSRYASKGYLGQIGVVYIEGDTLRHTLILNTVPVDLATKNHGPTIINDTPPWERDPDDARGKIEKPLRGPASCYTWQSRRAIVEGTETGSNRFFFSNGDEVGLTNGFSFEFMTSWKLPSKKRVFLPQIPSIEEAAWRRLPSVLPQLDHTTRFRPPEVVNFYSRLIQRRLAPRTPLMKIHTTAVVYQNDHIKELIDDEIDIPQRLLDKTSLRMMTVVRDAMKQTKDVADALQELAANLDHARGKISNTSSGARNRASETFYHVIDEEFPRWLASLDGADPDTARDQWRSLLRSTAEQQQDTLVSTMPPTAFAGRGEGKGRMDVSRALYFFRSALDRALPRPTSTTPRDKDEERTPS
ncbi:MAG: type I-E CRISPR-associated protein Cse1/CasA [Actinomyces sp.]|uniref:type I-E CRISPR-associated protein Cse1/CasA n=1 Tax=Actinomyces sp. TaxID=29317 RepID=UPI0026DBE3DF|nr:type I-E CRISPR-associated protein Cse1/CasA [Actinomyces sp.]MDO4244093.1 type I-E CRISPR-associated protein Cse1/CasA [Actinomyces sp.]